MTDIFVNKYSTLHPQVKPIKYNQDEIGGGVDCILTGWGYTTMIRFGSPPNNLQMIVLPTITNKQCNDSGMNVGSGEICTYSRYGQGACGVSIFIYFFFRFELENFNEDGN